MQFSGFSSLCPGHIRRQAVNGDRRGGVATFSPDLCGPVDVTEGVYALSEGSRLPIEAMRRTGLVTGSNVLELCTGSGVVGIAAAELGAASVTAFDICPVAVGCERANARGVGVS